MNTRPEPCVVLFVANVARMTTFYAQVGTMRVVSGDAEHSVLQIDGFQLVIHQLRGETDPSGGGQMPPAVREDAYAKLCLPVRSIDEARTVAAPLGGSIKPASAEWEARGFRACDGHDPEGNVIQVREAVS